MLQSLLALPALIAFDIDSEGRLLVGYDGSGIRQVHEVDVDGNWRALTALGERVLAAKYVPGSRTVIVEHDTGGDERGQLSTLDLTGEGLPELLPLVHDDRYLHHLIAARHGRVLFTTNRRNEVDFDLVALDLGHGLESVLYDGGGFVSTVDASPDDRWVLVTRGGGPANSEQALLIEAATGAVTEVTGFDDQVFIGTVSWLPDSSGVLLSADFDRDRLAVLRYDLGTRALTEVVADGKRDLAGWASPDGEHLLVSANEDGEVALALHRIDGEFVAPIDLPPGGCGAILVESDPRWSADGGHVVLTYSSPIEPQYVIRYSVADQETVTVKAPDAPELPDDLRHPVTDRVPSFDGEEVPVFVFRPADGGDGSAVVLVHGGPEWQSSKIWNPLIAGLVEEGHTVVVPNVRGSSGYGKRWYSLDDRDLRLDSVRDLAAIHAWLPSIGVDQRRAALWGGSYGGYMVLAGLAFQPELWAAGVDIVGIASLVTFLENTSAYRRTVREREYGYLATDREFLTAASPLNRVDAITAPLFVIHGANDPRVPLSEAEQIVAALAERDVPCRLLVYPDEGHGLSKRKNRLDAFPQAFAFLREHLAS
ncbi:dipeptidyl aminopeptidase/acylaminoacyl peptidase [Kribbella amoyensis]|uniref:Dipeptidyl aminopeptidase/acylaminoacyl peptidase n=1 Tax=Kribbella amoyensis TaxID=996641 RepID=A0A561BPJ9_9ACTN|nr:S9 family peptidase [Kribbella amoyensis]TWD80752.1 dipeptidyl aminopeptidase/acylaminoacyl peptidase [Kribbella amoyensis]